MLFRRILPTSTAILCSLVLSTLVPAQGARTLAPGERHQGSPSLLPVVFHGIVLDPDGAPGSGALVMSSAGGKTVADLRGRYRFEADVPPEAERVQVTAFLGDGRSLIAHASVEIGAASRFVRVEPLLLAPGATCPPAWLPTFGGMPGVDGTITAMTVFDDGSGPALHIAGDFKFAGGIEAHRIVKWDGSTWSALGAGIVGQFNVIHALAVFDDGNGPALYAGGSFVFVDGVKVNHIAKWDGTAWSAVGSGPVGVLGTVSALDVFDDGNGPALYVGGSLSFAGGMKVKNIAKWDGTNWSALVGGGTDYSVSAFSVFDDGTGPALHVGGYFFHAGGVPANFIAKWDGTAWSPLGSGLDSVPEALTVFDDGTGPALYVGGTARGVGANGIAKWDGSVWAPLSSGVNGEVQALRVFDDGTGPALYAGGSFWTAGGVAVKRIAKWDGSGWSGLDEGVDGPYLPPRVLALAVFDGGNGPALHAGGDFSSADGVTANRIAKWDGSSWASLATSDKGFMAGVATTSTFDDGGGPALYAGGGFTPAGGVATINVAKWNGSSWSALGSGMNNVIRVLSNFDDGSGPALYAGGSFTTAGGTGTNRIAKWNGSSWSPVGSGVSGGNVPISVNALASFDDGGGPSLYAGGSFTTAGSTKTNYIARWDGSSWSALGSGMNGYVYSLAVHDDGNGSALYAGGIFATAGGVAANRVAKWDGSSWSALGSGMNFYVYSLAVHDDGNGPALYAGGNFTTAGGVAASQVAKWDGSSWQPLGSGVGGGEDIKVLGLITFDDGTGPALYAGGQFTTAGGVAASSIARWDGSSWSALGSGTSPGINALSVFDDGDGAALYAGGGFISAPDSRDSFLAKWGCSLVTTHDKTRRR